MKKLNDFKIILISGILSLLCINTFSQPVSWKKCDGGTDDDYATSTVIDNSYQYVTVGRSNSSDGDLTVNQGDYDSWIMRTDTSGNMIDQKSFGGTLYDEFNHVLQVSSGAYGVLGATSSNDGDVTGNHGALDAWGLVMDGGLTVLGGGCYGGSGDDVFRWGFEISGSGFLACGYTASPNDGDVSGKHGGKDAWVVKLDVLGAIVWQKCLGGSLDDFATSCILTSDGNYLIACYSASNDGDLTSGHGLNDYWLVKLDPSGSIIWQRNYGGSNDEYSGEVIEASDGNYILTGGSNSDDQDVTVSYGNYDTWVIKADKNNGNLIWQKSFGGSIVDYCFSISEGSGQQLFLGGHSVSSDGFVSATNGNMDYWLLALDASGNYMGNETWGGTGLDFSTSLCVTTDNEIIISGTTDSNDSDVSANHGAYDIWILKTTSIISRVSDLSSALNMRIAPNPAVSEVKISCSEFKTARLELHNVLGEIIVATEFEGDIVLDCSRIPMGIYDVKLIDSEKSVTQKLIIF